MRTEVGNTPLVEVGGIYTKLECVNPTGSVKDRMVWHILQESLRSGALRPGMRIVEATSGNTGISLAFFGKKFGFPVTIVMPENMTQERKELIRGLGAELILVSREGSFAEAVRVRDEQAGAANVFVPDQFGNPLNPEAHERTTGLEILRQLPEERRSSVVFVAGVGTGGTLMGVARALRRGCQAVKVVAVEPAESAVMSGGEPAAHTIYGIGDGFIPDIVKGPDGKLSAEIDQVEVVSQDEALEAAKRIAADFAICVGVSSGANFVAARRRLREGVTVVTVFADGASKYAGHGLPAPNKQACAFGVRCPEPIPDRAGVRNL